MPARSMEENGAFMPTSNDSLFSPINNENNLPTKSTPNSNPALLRKTSSPYFASPALRSSLEGSKVSSKAQSPMSGPPPALPRSQSSLARKRANSAPKPIEPAVDDEPDPEDKIFWYNLYMETIDNHDREKTSTAKAMRHLRKEIESLKQELHDTRSRMVRAGNAYIAEEEADDKTFTTQAIINNANAKLREFSVVSPEQERGNPFDKPSPTQLDGVKIRNKSVGMSSRDKSSSRGPSLSRRVTIADETAVTIDEPNGDTPDQIIPPENPASPPPTAFHAQSPPPHNFIMHAGSTPRSVRSLISKDARRSQPSHSNHSNHSIASAMANHDSELSVTFNDKNPTAAPSRPNRIPLPAFSDLDDGDRPLKSPQMLPTNPSTPSTQRNDPFSVLTSKLQRIASDPEQQIPVVLREHKSLAHEDEIGVSMKKMDAGGLGVAKELTNCGSGSKGHEESKENDAGKIEMADSVMGDAGNDDEKLEDSVGEIVFKKQKATNFGAPLGQLK